MGTSENGVKPPTDLLTDPERFWSLAGELNAPPAMDDAAPALKRLGPVPVPKGKFPLMGFLATVYEHVAEHVRSGRSVDENPPSR